MALETWMGDKFGTRGGTKLSQMTMPGAHDAGMYEVMAGTGSKGKKLTQFDNVQTQLNNGTRFFDIRVYFKNKVPRIGHFANKGFSSPLGGYGPPFQDVMTDMSTFITSNPSEIIIVKATLSNDTRAAKGGGWGATTNVIPWDKLWIADTQAKKHIAGLTYNQAHGHIILCFETDLAPKDKHLTVPQKQKIHFVQKVSYTAPISPMAPLDRGTLHLGGKAPEKSELSKVLSKQKEAIKDSEHTNAQNRLNLFYLTITSPLNTVESNTIRELRMAGPDRNPVSPVKTQRSGWGGPGQYGIKMDEALRWKTGYKPNIIHYDFVNRTVNNMIIDINP